MRGWGDLFVWFGSPPLKEFPGPSCLLISLSHNYWLLLALVLDPGKGVCADPRGGDATLGVGGPGPPKGGGEHQLSPDRGGEKT